MTTVAMILLVYAGLVIFGLALLNAAGRGGDSMERAVEGAFALPGPPHPGRDGLRTALPVEVLDDDDGFGRLAAQVRDRLAVERVTVIVAEDSSADMGIVAACLGAPGQLGQRIPLVDTPSTGLLTPDEAAALSLTGATPGGASWSYAHVPLDGPDGVRGAVMVAARRVLAFSSGEMTQIERLARRGAPRFERRGHERTAA